MTLRRVSSTRYGTPWKMCLAWSIAISSSVICAFRTPTLCSCCLFPHTHPLVLSLTLRLLVLLTAFDPCADIMLVFLLLKHRASIMHRAPILTPATLERAGDHTLSTLGLVFVLMLVLALGQPWTRKLPAVLVTSGGCTKATASWSTPTAKQGKAGQNRKHKGGRHDCPFVVLDSSWYNTCRSMFGNMWEAVQGSSWVVRQETMAEAWS